MHKDRITRNYTRSTGCLGPPLDGAIGVLEIQISVGLNTPKLPVSFTKLGPVHRVLRQAIIVTFAVYSIQIPETHGMMLSKIDATSFVSALEKEYW